MSIELVYDLRFDDVEIEDVNFADCVKDRLEDVLALNIPRDDYVTIEDLEEEFSVSRYQVTKYLEQLGAEPFGELKNYTEEGRRTRGVGKVVYRKSVVDDIKNLTSTRVDVAAIKAQAAAILQKRD